MQFQSRSINIWASEKTSTRNCHFFNIHLPACRIVSAHQAAPRSGLLHSFHFQRLDQTFNTLSFCCALVKWCPAGWDAKLINIDDYHKNNWSQNPHENVHVYKIFEPSSGRDLRLLVHVNLPKSVGISLMSYKHYIDDHKVNLSRIIQCNINFIICLRLSQ